MTGDPEFFNGTVEIIEVKKPSGNSPVDRGDCKTTQATELSLPCSSYQTSSVPKNPRLLAEKKLETLSQDEKVYSRVNEYLSSRHATNLETGVSSHGRRLLENQGNT